MLPVNVGLDFGTTYTVVSHMEDGQPNAVELEQGNVYRPSMVVKDQEGDFLFGTEARNSAYMPDCMGFSGFKMMLAERDENALRARGYTEDCTPEKVTSVFLNDVITTYLRRRNLNNIDKLVIGVPEVWFGALTGASDNNQNKLKDIINGIKDTNGNPKVNEVKLVSEPAAACAFFVHNYRNNTGQDFNGKILLIDYGGGTLDITLCEVNQNGEHSEVTPLTSTGAGLNREGMIGKAGLAFQEELLIKALEASEDEHPRRDDILSHKDFYPGIAIIESSLMNKMANIEEVMGILSADETNENFANKKFSGIGFNGRNYNVTYGMMKEAYDNVISNVLEDNLRKIIDYMDDAGIDYSSGSTDNFKIALVGGFGKFYLVQKQVKNMFSECVDDRRFSDIISVDTLRERAITYGSAIIASGAVDFREVSRYSLGFRDDYGDYHFTIKKGDEYKFDEPIFAKYEDGADMVFRGRSIPAVFSNLYNDISKALSESMPKEYKERFALEARTLYKIGFSLDRSKVVTIHLWKVQDGDRPEDIRDGDKTSIRFKEFDSLFPELIPN
jgi:molecular chaperone DnaK